MIKRLLTLSGSFVAFVAVCFVAFASPVHAATITVSAGTDTIAEDGVCHLSEAIANVNDQAQTHADCPAGTGNDTIQLPAGTITLSTHLPSIKKPLVIKGAGMGKSIIDSSGGEHYGLRSSSEADAESTFDFSGFTLQAIYEHGMFFANSTVHLRNIEIDGRGSPQAAVLHGIVVGSGSGGRTDATLSDIYIHDFPAVGQNATGAINVAAEGGATTEATLERVTIANLSDASTGGANGILFSTGIATGSFTPGAVKATVRNTTVKNIKSTTTQAAGLAALAGVYDGSSSVEVDARHVTLADIVGIGGVSAGIATGSVAVNPEDQAAATIKLKNSIVTYPCMVVDDLAGMLGAGTSAGTTSQSISSQGGNLTDDTSCQDHLTHATDKHNVTNLKTLLGSLGDHGGTVPTIPLLPGNLAIDGGVCDGAPATDARGIARPQGAGCDAGAFEVQQALMASAGGITNETTGKRIYLTPPIPGSVVSVAELLSASQVARDASYTYPLGLVSFTIDGVPTGSTQTIELFFETDARAEDFELRKYNPAKHSFSAIDNATLTNETKDGTPGIKASYQLTDGGALDLDGTANGTLVDPVGLARKQSASLVNTGSVTFVSMLLALIIITIVLFSYRSYRKFKAPIIQNDQETNQSFAKDYTYWHHLKVVTLPTLRYRFTIIIEKKTQVSPGKVAK